MCNPTLGESLVTWTLAMRTGCRLAGDYGQSPY